MEKGKKIMDYDKIFEYLKTFNWLTENDAKELTEKFRKNNEARIGNSRITDQEKEFLKDFKN